MDLHLYIHTHTQQLLRRTEYLSCTLYPTFSQMNLETAWLGKYKVIPFFFLIDK